jgi:Glycine zipper
VRRCLTAVNAKRALALLSSVLITVRKTMILNMLQSVSAPLRSSRFTAGISVLIAALALSACVVPPPRERVVTRPAPAVETDLYVYPSNGQSEAQTDRDRYECHEWAVAQSHYDPSRTNADASERVVVRTVPPSGADTAAGAITGGVLGAIVGGPRHAAGGALVGAVAGAVAGAASDNAREEHAAEVQGRYDRSHAAAVQRAQSYRRAISACLEGRGYTVK